MAFAGEFQLISKLGYVTVRHRKCGQDLGSVTDGGKFLHIIRQHECKHAPLSQTIPNQANRNT